ncbi:MAG TPA: efflux RND transporter periplasmic adaptor subunit [Ignavibacteriaceae bacterium]|nr:efflux RND transporter periplasmic adaptor subunit [Ignavibacteriaceae bacterium]
MKIKKNHRTIAILVILLALVVARLISNKSSFDREQKLVSESINFVPVITEKVAFTSVDNNFSADGTFTPEKEVTISSEISGKVISVKAEIGSYVDEGQVLAITDHTILSVQMEQAKANLQMLEKDLQRNKALLKTDGATGEQVEQSKQAVIDAQTTLTNLQFQYDNSFIKAPFSGIITKRYIEKGAFLSPGSETFDLCDMYRLQLIVKVTANQVNEIKKGQKVKVAVDAIPDKLIDGTIYTINDKADQSKQYEVEISVDNTLNGQIKPGMFGKASFEEQTDSKKLVIPRVAISGSSKNADVFLVKGDSVVTRKITVTSLNEKEVAVTAGLNEGDVIVVSGQINLTDGTKVEIIK